MRRKNRTKIRTLPQGIEFSIPNRHRLPVYITTRTPGFSRTEKEKLPPFISFFIFILYSSSVLIFPLRWLDILPVHSTPDTKNLITGLLSWCLLEGYFVYQLFTAETLTFSTNEISIGKSLFRYAFNQKHYQAEKIMNLRLNPEEHSKQGFFLFEYEGQPIRYGKDIDRQEAETLLQQWADIMRFHCHAVTHVMFGTFSLNATQTSTHLQNPDVSALTFPFVHLKQILIDTATYDFYQVERFLTYALNYIEHAYLKESVEVHLYGNPEQFHPNLRNGLTNLCKHLYLHETQATDIRIPQSHQGGTV